MLRSIVAVVLGVVVAAMIALALETAGHQVFQPPQLDLNDWEAAKALVAQMPVWVLGVVLLAWACGSFGGGWVAARLAGRAPIVHALIVGAIQTLFGIATMLMIPHPPWFVVGALLCLLPPAYVGGWLASPQRDVVVQESSPSAVS
jgi:MFS family permease